VSAGNLINQPNLAIVKDGNGYETLQSALFYVSVVYFGAVDPTPKLAKK